MGKKFANEGFYFNMLQVACTVFRDRCIDNLYE